jgi:DNA-binding beta-propeller fold protein YncE
MNSGFSSPIPRPKRRWVIVVAACTAVFLTSCTDMTTDAQPVLRAVAIPGLSQRTKDSMEAWICNYGYDSDPGATVTPVDLSRGVADSAVTTGTLPDAIAASPNGRLLVVADGGQDLLAVINSSTGDVLGRVTTGVEPDAVAVSPNGRLAVVADSGTGTVTVVNLETMHAARRLSVGAQPDAVAIGGRGGETALVANLGSGTVTPVDLDTMTAGRPIRVGEEPDAIALSPDGGSALVADLGSNEVTYLNLITLRAGPEIAVGVPPTGIATQTGPGGTRPLAWVSGGSSLVSVSFDGAHPVGAALPVGHLAEDVAIAPGAATAWVADGDPYITEVNLTTRQVVESVRVGGRPTQIVIPDAVH